MRYRFKYIHLLLPLFLLSGVIKTQAQYPGGVSTGSTRGYKADYYNGTFSDQTGFGAGTSNATPGNTGYSNKITGTEFNNIDADYYGMEYTGTLEITTAGNYTFSVAADDRIWLYIDNNLVVSAQTSTVTTTVNLTTGDHTIKVKYYELGGDNSASLKFTAVPAGATGFTLPTDVDGRFVRTDNSKLTAWYKASDLAVTANYGGAGVDKINAWLNKAPDYAGNGDMTYISSSNGSSSTSVNTQINFNPGVPFDGDDFFGVGANQKGLSYRGATKSIFTVANYTSGTGQTAWLFLHTNTTTTGQTPIANSYFGTYKTSNGTQTAIQGSGAAATSAWTAYEPKLLTGSLGQVLGAAAPSNTNPLFASANGMNGTSVNALSNVVSNASYNLRFGTTTDPGAGAINTARIPEAIYYPFKLSTTQEQQVNSYLAIKYGITLAHDYLNTLGTPIYNVTTTTPSNNGLYINRVFGIGRELVAEGLNQKQSQSQMTSTTGYDFLVVSKDTSITTTNALNNGVLADGNYLLMGDNNGALTVNAAPATTPTALASSCVVNTLNRMWKVQNTGAVTNVTLQAGSATSGSFLFPASAANVSIWIDATGTGNFTNATVVSASSVTAAGVATFKGVNLPNGSVFTFGWSLTSPGGVSTGLTLWTKADDPNLALGNVGVWADFSPNKNNLSRGAGGGMTKVDNKFNYNPSVYFGGGDNYYTSSINPLGMNGINKYAEFYVLTGKGGFTSGEQWDEIITLGGDNHRWENSVVGLSGGSYGVYGNGTANGATGSSVFPTMANLGLYSNTADGTNAILRTNGVIRTTNPTSANLSLSGNFRIGTDVVDAGGSNWNNFYVPELIVYNTNLSATQITQINSYLGIKYSIPLADGTSTDYLASDGITKPWIADANYKYGVFGIGRDDCSGLNQRQSKAYVDGTDNVAFGLTTLATTNAANTGSFAANKQFIMIANDNGVFSATTANVPPTYASCNAARYVRSWKVKNTGAVTNMLQVTVGDTTNKIPANWNKVALAVDTDGDGNFATGTTAFFYATNILGGVATFDNVVLNDGVVFTVVSTIGYPGGVSKPTGTSIAATIAGVDYMNGLAYKMYRTNGTSNRNLSTTPFTDGANGDILSSTGYLNNTASFSAFAAAKGGASDLTNFGVELTGKLNITNTLSTYRFQLTGDDQAYFEIKNSSGTLMSVPLTITANATTASATDISLPAGLYDIIVRGANNGGAANFDLKWSTNSGGAYTAIPDNMFLIPAAAVGLSAWYQSDDNALAVNADGANLNTLAWNDLSGNGNTVIGNGDPTYYYTTSNNTGIGGIRNYNPSIYFTKDWFYRSGYLNGFAYGRTAKSIFATGSNNNNTTNGETMYSAFGRDNGTGTNFGITRLSGGTLQLFTASNNLNEGTAFYNSANYTTDIISGQLSSAGLGKIYANGASRLSATLPTPAFNTQFNDNDQLQVGSGPDYSGRNYAGNLNEIVYYPWELSVLERQKVNSYLAIKWGITLDQTTPTNYIASDGSTVWNASLNADFNLDITGIGRDDCGNLNQKQSTSTDGGDIISIGRGSIAANNLVNTNTFTNNLNFMMFGHNANVFTTNTNTMPATLAGCYVKVDREWLVQSTGTPGSVNVEVGKNGLLSINAANYKPVLLITDIQGNYTNAAIVNVTRVYQGKAYFDNVTQLTNGKYFTLAYINAAPGGVTTNMTTWFNVDYDLFTDAAQTQYVAADGDPVASINNMKFGATFSSVNQVNASYNPLYKPGTFNYNTGVLFDGVNDVLASTSNINSSDYRSTTAMTSVFSGKVASSTGQVFWFHDNNGAGTVKTSLERTKAYWSNSTANILARNPALTVPEIYSFANSTSGSWRLYSNLNTVGTGTTNNTDVQNVSGRFRIGNDNLSGAGSPANFYLGEFVIYSDDKGAATSLDMRKIHSYMATKYGFTLDKTAMGTQYIASNGTPTYTDGNYWNRITGIGRDDCSALEQKQSFSQEAVGAMVKISNDAVNGMAATNATNTASFTADKSFLLFGDNNKSLTWNGVNSIVYSGTSLMRLNRVWRVKETGTISTVYLQVPGNTSTAAVTDKLPVPKNSATDPIYLIVANSASGGSFNNPVVVPMIPNGTDWTVTYDFTDGDYYTFATVATCLAPGGNSDGLTSWYRADNKSNGTIAVTNGTMVDETGNYLLTRNGTGTATVNAGTPASNYNKTLALASGAFLQTGSTLSETAITANNAGTLYGVALGINSTGLFGLSRSNYDLAGVFGVASFGNLGVPNTGTPVANAPNFWSTVQNNGVTYGSVNGTTATGTANNVTLLANSTNSLRVGAYYATTTLTPGNNTFMEAFSYNRALSTAEQQVLNSYLAIKNGQTLPHNYYSPAYDGTNALATTIYDITAPYSNRIFGVGNDISGCLAQNQSTSALTGSMLKISIEGAIMAENSGIQSKWLQDRSYIVMGDDNGLLTWSTANKPKTLAGNTCVNRIARQWKVTTTNTVPALWVTIPDSTNTLSATKLNTVPANNDVYVVVSDQADFTSAMATQQVVKMTLNPTSKEWEASIDLDANLTRYITFIYQPPVCGLPCVPVNPATSRVRLK